MANGWLQCKGAKYILLLFIPFHVRTHFFFLSQSHCRRVCAAFARLYWILFIVGRHLSWCSHLRTCFFHLLNVFEAFHLYIRTRWSTRSSLLWRKKNSKIAERERRSRIIIKEYLRPNQIKMCSRSLGIEICCISELRRPTWTPQICCCGSEYVWSVDDFVYVWRPLMRTKVRTCRRWTHTHTHTDKTCDTRLYSICAHKTQWYRRCVRRRTVCKSCSLKMRADNGIEESSWEKWTSGEAYA